MYLTGLELYIGVYIIAFWKDYAYFHELSNKLPITNAWTTLFLLYFQQQWLLVRITLQFLCVTLWCAWLTVVVRSLIAILPWKPIIKRDIFQYSFWNILSKVSHENNVSITHEIALIRFVIVIFKTLVWQFSENKRDNISSIYQN